MSIQQKYDTLTSTDKLVNVVGDLHGIVNSLKALPSSVSAAYLEENRILRERKRKIEHMFAKIAEIRGSKDIEELELKLKQKVENICYLEQQIRAISLENDTLKTTQKNYGEQVSALKYILQERDEKISELMNKIKELEGTIEKRDYDLELSREDVHQIKKQLRANHFYQASEINKLNVLLRNKQDEIEELQSVVQHNEIGILNNQLREKDLRITNLLDSNSKKDDEIDRLKKIIEKFQTALDESEDEVDYDPLKEFIKTKTK